MTCAGPLGQTIVGRHQGRQIVTFETPQVLFLTSKCFREEQLSEPNGISLGLQRSPSHLVIVISAIWRTPGLITIDMQSFADRAPTAGFQQTLDTAVYENMVSLQKSDLLDLRGSAMPPSSDIDPIRIWCEQELVLMRRQTEFLQSGRIGTYEWDDHGRQIETSSQTAKQLEMKITALEGLLSRNQFRTQNHADDTPTFTKPEVARE